MRCSPNIHPTPEHSDGYRNFALFQGGKAPIKRDKVCAVNREGAEGIIESPINNLLEGIANLLQINSSYQAICILICESDFKEAVRFLRIALGAPSHHLASEGNPKEAFLRLQAIGVESHTSVDILEVRAKGRWSAEVTSSCLIHSGQLVMVEFAVLKTAEAEAATMDLIFGPPRSWRWKKSAWQTVFWGVSTQYARRLFQ